MKRPKVEVLTAEGFAPFGDVIEAHGAPDFMINEGSAGRYHHLARLDPGPHGCITVNIFRGQGFKPPVALTQLERHPLGSQAFFPLERRPYLVAVAPGDSAPDLERLRVFLARGDQGVHYLPGVWHHPLMALEETSDFLVLDRDGAGANCEIVRLPTVILLPLNASAANSSAPHIRQRDRADH